MDDLFVVYRYLTNSRHTTDHQNPYTIAHRALDSYLEIECEIASYANKIHTTGGLQWSEAEKLTEHILTGFETGLNNHHGDVLSAAIHFMQKYLSLDDIGDLIEACKHEQARLQREEDEARAEEERQFLLDAGSMLEDQ
ncbi:MAG TPA: hypothetical protein VFA10_00415 [Ktedonobacteraceae bacterium]|nr:hypothetical protein [Ktedonobacteraceae bacterium]